MFTRDHSGLNRQVAHSHSKEHRELAFLLQQSTSSLGISGFTCKAGAEFNPRMHLILDIAWIEDGAGVQSVSMGTMA